MMTDTQQDELQGWREKYYDTLGDLEAREKRWARIEQLLRQGLNRLSLAADDSDDGLNRQLEALRAEIRKGRPSEELQERLDVISEAILRLDEARKNLRQLPTPAELMMEILDRIQLPRGMEQHGRALRRRLAAASREECGALSEEFAALITETLGGVVGAQEGRKGLLGKVFRGREAVAGAQGLQVAKELLTELIHLLVREEGRRDTLTGQVQASAEAGQLHRLAHELAERLRTAGEAPCGEEPMLPVNEVLVRLLERLDIPAELEQQVAAVKVMLVRQLHADEMDNVLMAIAELIAGMRSRMQSEKAEIESFLIQLTTRLQEIDHSFQGNVATQRESFRDGEALDDAVKQQVAGIEESVQQARELTDLKATLQQRVDTIRNHMLAFRQAEEQRRQQAEQQVAVLTKKLELVQGESHQLRQRLHDERNQAMVDPLTGIPNRLAYNERLEQEFVRWRRYGTPLTVAVWDVDNFKSVNDTYGHQAGDKVLTIIARLLHEQSRETDFVARFGGEEFVLLLPSTALENSVTATEYLRRAVAATEFHFRGKRVPITISCGASEFLPGDSPEAVFERADKALYEAKRNGRNRCHKG
ncbi:MAG: GGDEF domain-containing protein [Gammaproteobacteria bacterium]|nr:GGDEF domain-containing protein [Gammaproteobacteria bacterium]